MRNGIYCFWKWENGWVLSHCKTDYIYGDHFNWMYNEEEEILGRAITQARLFENVKLLGYHPPEWTVFITPFFYDFLKESCDWYKYINQGEKLYFETVNEAEKIYEGSIHKSNS